MEKGRLFSFVIVIMIIMALPMQAFASTSRYVPDGTLDWLGNLCWVRDGAVYYESSDMFGSGNSDTVKNDNRIFGYHYEDGPSIWITGYSFLDENGEIMFYEVWERGAVAPKGVRAPVGSRLMMLLITPEIGAYSGTPIGWVPVDSIRLSPWPSAGKGPNRGPEFDPGPMNPAHDRDDRPPTNDVPPRPPMPEAAPPSPEPPSVARATDFTLETVIPRTLYGGVSFVEK